MIAGVCGGLAEYLDTDPTLIRVIWALLVLFAGTGVVLYLILWVIMPPDLPDSPRPAPGRRHRPCVFA